MAIPVLEGLPPNGAAFVASVRCKESVALAIVDIVSETFDPAETAAAAFEQGDQPPRWTSDLPWTAEIFFRDQTIGARLYDLIAHVAGEAIAGQLSIETVAERDWVASSLAGLAAVRVGRFVLHGSHGRDQVRIGDIGIEIEAALAFGTGHHGTTKGCLVALNNVARRRRPQRVLDVGTGTGVLAIAAARRFKRTIQSGDIDPIAVQAARANARANAACSAVHPVRCIGVRHPRLQAHGPYDLVFANILARPLRQLAPAFRRIIASGGELILSGLLVGDVPGVLSMYRAQHFRLVRRFEIEGWVTLMMQRPSA